MDYYVRAGSAQTVPEFVDTTTYGQTATTIGSQVTDSEDHPGWRKRLNDADSKQDIGGDFFSQKNYAYGKPNRVHLQTEEFFSGSYSANRGHYTGNVWSIDARTMPFPPAMNSSAAQLDQLGATAIARVKPTNSTANVSTTLAELVREGIPSIAVGRWKDRTRLARNASEANLAYQFGFKPLGQEIGTFAAAVLQADQLLAQYERDAGRVVRRRFEFPTKSETISTTDISTSTSVFYEPFNTRLMDSSLSSSVTGTLVRERAIFQRRWFAGAFTYYLPPWYNPRNEMSRKALLAKEILGVDLTPEVVWNLAPWSWAVDWFSNVGDVLANVSDTLTDSLLLRYGYIMEHTIVRDTYTRRHPKPFKDKGVSIDSFVTLVTETKMRRRANPFGFGVSWSGLTPKQLSILASLGITKSGR